MTTLGLAIREPERIVVEALTLIAASDLLHAAVIPVNRDRPTAKASVAAFVSVAIIVPVMVLTPTWAANVNNAGGSRADIYCTGNCQCELCRPRPHGGLRSFCVQSSNGGIGDRPRVS